MSWLSLAGSLLSWVLGLFGFGKPDLEAEGEKSGKAQAQGAAAMEELREEDSADKAVLDLSGRLKSGGVRAPDGDERT